MEPQEHASTGFVFSSEILESFVCTVFTFSSCKTTAYRRQIFGYACCSKPLEPESIHPVTAKRAVNQPTTIDPSLG